VRLRREDVVAFVKRDWRRVREAKERFWADAGGDRFEMAEGLRRHARAVLPNWPTEKQREEDLEAHRRVAEALARVPPISRR